MSARVMDSEKFRNILRNEGCSAALNASVADKYATLFAENDLDRERAAEKKMLESRASKFLKSSFFTIVMKAFEKTEGNEHNNVFEFIGEYDTASRFTENNNVSLRAYFNRVEDNSLVFRVVITDNYETTYSYGWEDWVEEITLRGYLFAAKDSEFENICAEAAEASKAAYMAIVNANEAARNEVKRKKDADDLRKELEAAERKIAKLRKELGIDENNEGD